MNCVKCGSVIAEGNNFCMICGFPKKERAIQAFSHSAEIFAAVNADELAERSRNAAKELE